MPTSQPVVRDETEAAMTVVGGIDAMLGYWDASQRCRFANEAYRKWFGRTPQELVGLPIQELLGPLYELNLPYIRAALEGEVQVFERTIPLPDGTVRHTIASYYPDIANRTVRGFSAHVTDVTRMKRLEMELATARERAEHLATHDFLTGVFNRVDLTARIQAAMTYAKMKNGLVGVVAVDFDDFKMINDRFGHDVGDAVLKETARRMERATRATDTVTRLGGDEFIYLATELDACDDLHRTVNRLKMMVSQKWSYKGADIEPSLCCGIAVYPWHGKSPVELLARADRALYAAKRSGPGEVAYARLT